MSFQTPLVTDFAEQLTASFEPIIELKSNYGLSIYRDQITETNSGTVTHSGAEFVLSTGSTTNSVARLRSAERGRYQPGQECLPGIAALIDQTPTGDLDARWGYTVSGTGATASLIARFEEEW